LLLEGVSGRSRSRGSLVEGVTEFQTK
jgi:hypothetical protein